MEDLDKAVDISQIENAARIVLSPPNAASKEERKEAELLFLQLRQRRNPYHLCRLMLEGSSVEYVQYEAVTIMREAVITEWNALPKVLPEELKEYLIQHLKDHYDSMASYVGREMIHLVAIIIKRLLLVDRKALSHALLMIQKLIKDGFQALGIAMMTAVVKEFGCTTGRSEKGLSLEFLVDCKKTIEASEMISAFTLALELLEEFILYSPNQLAQNSKLFKLLVEFAVQILTWDFTHRLSAMKGFQHYELYVTPLRPPATWKFVLLDSKVIAIMFKLTVLVRGDAPLLHSCLQCLSQLASLIGPVLSSPEAKQKYLHSFGHELAAYLELPNLTNTELCGIAAVTRRLLDTFPLSHIIQIEVNLLSKLLGLLSQLTVSACKKSTQDSDEEVQAEIQETLDSVLGVWIRLVSDPSFLASPWIPSLVTEIVEAYIKSKLGVPEGWRTHCNEQEVHLSIADGSDLDVYSDQLLAVASMVHCDPQPALFFLVTMFNPKVLHLAQYCSMVQSGASCREVAISELYEDIHWLVLFSGHVLASVCEGESPLIPQPLMKLSISTKSQNYSSEDILKFIKFEVPGFLDDATSYCHLMSTLDPVVTLVVRVLQVSHLFAMMSAAGLAELCSPQVAEILAWFHIHWTRTYLNMKEDDYEQVSITLCGAFGAQSPGADALTLYLLERASSDLCNWASEEKVFINTCKFLSQLLKSNSRSTTIQQSQPFWQLLHYYINCTGFVSSMSSECQRHFIEMLVLGAGASDANAFCDTLVQGVVGQLASLLKTDSNPQEAGVQRMLVFHLESLCGLAKYIKPSQATSLFVQLSPLLESLVSLFKVYVGHGNVIILLLELFNLVAKCILPHVSKEHTSVIFELCLAVLRNYSNYNVNKYKEGVLAEEEQCDDLIVCFELLENLTTKDFFDFSSPPDAVYRLTGEVVFCGLGVILNVMTDHLLEYPVVNSKFYNLLSFLCESYVDIVVQLEQTYFITLCNLLESGITRQNTDIAMQCLDCLGTLSRYSLREEEQKRKPHVIRALQHFLRVIFQTMFRSTFHVDLIPPLSAAILPLMHLCKDVYNEMVLSLIGNQQSHEHQEKLLEAFKELTPNSDLTMQNHRQSNIRFTKKLETFLYFTRSFLQLS